jgi:hypothetical protein
MQGDRLGDPVALVEDAEHGDPLRHRRDRLLRGGCPPVLGDLRTGGVLLLARLAARSERERD